MSSQALAALNAVRMRLNGIKFRLEPDSVSIETRSQMEITCEIKGLGRTKSISAELIDDKIKVSSVALQSGEQIFPVSDLNGIERFMDQLDRRLPK